MRTILKTIKKFTFPIILVFVLLVTQATCDLALPDYTANIVNVGIQQNGIESPVPEAIRESQLEKILLFSNENDTLKIKNSYDLITKGDSEYIEKYPILEDENVYVLKDISKEELTSLEETITLPIILVSSVSMEDFDASVIIGNPLPVGVGIFDVLKVMSNEEKNQMLKKIEEKYKEELSLIEQKAIYSVKNEYETIGIDVESMQIRYITIAGLKMLAIALLAMIITIITVFISIKIAAYLGRDLRSKVVNKVMTYSNNDFEDLGTASLITRTTNDISQIQMLIVMLLRIVFYAPILGLGALTKVSGSDMSWVIGLAVLVIISLVIILFTVVMPKFQKVQKLIDKLNLVAREIITGVPVIRAFSNEKYEEVKFDKANKDLTKVNLFVNRVMTIMMPTMMFIMNVTCVLVIWVGADKIDAGTLQVGTLMAFITYTVQIIMSFLMISIVSIMVPRAFVSMKRLGEVFDKDVSIKEIDKPMKFDVKKKGIVEFKDVYFRYPDAEEDVLQNISFTSNPGTTTAFIGFTGSGKSTLINLIPRFFDVTGGKVLVDGVNIKDVKIHDLRDKIGYVPQKGMLFKGTIKSNIEFGTKKLSKEQLEKSARISQSLEFIGNKENKYNAEISQGGTNVSGGQRQRLAIARALATNPEIYIFDDSFSALDYKTDMKLRKALAKETKNATIFIVAQRISTVMQADQIIVLNEGKIVGTGTHEKLLQTCEIYKEIALSQLSKEELS